jgi:hypothetical protein
MSLLDLAMWDLRGIGRLKFSVYNQFVSIRAWKYAKIFYHTIEGDYVTYASNKYQNNHGIQPSMLYKDFQKK